jgi:hypothetical protein
MVYRSLVEQQLAAEFERRRALEGRGATLMTASASLLALIFGLSILVTGKDYVLLDSWAVGCLVGALLAFVLSASIAVIVQTYGFKYEVTPRDTLRSLARDDDQWKRRADDAMRMWVSQQAQTICSLRAVNDRKAKLVAGSLAFQLLAVALLSVSIGLDLYARL